MKEKGVNISVEEIVIGGGLTVQTMLVNWINCLIIMDFRYQM